jgi:hypothetical protein
VLEIAESCAAIVALLAEQGMLDRVPERCGTFHARVAADELWLIGPATDRAALLDYATTCLEAAGPAALAVDVTDAWAVCTVTGDRADQMWARLSSNPLPSTRPAFVQGAVASLPAKVIVGVSCLHVLTPSPVAHHLPRRVLEACPDLGPCVGAAMPFTVDGSLAPAGPVASAGATALGP